MSELVKEYKDGEVIFREGEESLNAYVIRAGAVMLTKTGKAGEVPLTTLLEGELFGEMGLVDRGRRSATARAQGQTVLEIIPRAEFVKRLESEPEMAMDVMGKLVERLRATDELVVSRGAEAEMAGHHARELTQAQSRSMPETAEQRKSGGTGGLLSRLFRGGASLGKSQRGRLAGSTAEILVASLPGDEDGSLRDTLIKVFDGVSGLSVRGLPRRLEPGDQIEPADALAHAADTGRYWLTQDNADLLIWGQVDGFSGALAVHFVAATIPEDERPGIYAPFNTLYLPPLLEPSHASLLRACVLGGLLPVANVDARHIMGLLEIALEEIGEMRLDMPGMAGTEQAQILTCFANAVASAAWQAPRGPWRGKAAEIYSAALDRAQGSSPEETSFIHRQLALLMQMEGDVSGEPSAYESAAEHFRAAVKSFSRERDPRGWAGLQNRLGQTLYKASMALGDDEALKEAMTRYQNALQVFTRIDSPLRWAEVMNNMAQALQIYGDQVKSTEALNRAADLCRSALEVRTREETPLLWAATQNNLGSAEFLIAKHTEDSGHLLAAAEAFRGALGIYQANGATRMAEITEKNLGRAEALYRRKSKSSENLVSPDWAKGD